MAPKPVKPVVAAAVDNTSKAKKRKTGHATEVAKESWGAAAESAVRTGPDTPFVDMVDQELAQVPVPTPHGRALIDAPKTTEEEDLFGPESPKDRSGDVPAAGLTTAEAPREHAEEVPAAEPTTVADASKEHAEEPPAAKEPAGPRVKLGDVGQSDALVASLDSVAELCTKCGRETDILKCRVKTKSSGCCTVICNDCNCIMTMTGRKINPQSDVALSKLKDEDSIAFFRRACDTKGLSGRFDWEKIRGCIIETMTDAIVTKKSVTWSDKYLPLSVWERKGFDHKRIEAAGKCFEDKVLGWVYAAPLCVVSREATREHVEKTVRQAERKFVANSEDDDAKAELGDYATEHLAASGAGSSGHSIAPKNETPAKLKARLEREAAQKARAAEIEATKKAKAARSLNDKGKTLASRILLALDTIAKDFEKTRKTAEFDNFPLILKERFDQQEPKIKDSLAEAKEFNKKVTRASKNGEALAPLSITNDELKTMVSEARGLLSNAEQLAKMLTGAK